MIGHVINFVQELLDFCTLLCLVMNFFSHSLFYFLTLIFTRCNVLAIRLAFELQVALGDEAKVVRANFLESAYPASFFGEATDHFTDTYLQMSLLKWMEVSCHLVDSEVFLLLKLLQVLFSDLDAVWERLWN